MKKILSIVAAMALALSMAAVSVYAEEADEASAQADCLHTSGTVVEKQNWSKEYVNDELHNLTMMEYHYCRDCRMYLYPIGPYVYRTEGHDFDPGRYTSNHSGNYTEHYYTYSKTCKVCKGEVKRMGKTGCTAKRCIEPQ
ncbi:MAG: hypothetical protein K2O34_14950 [Acetatifactor sp.]|nr:hypothetical protein [Acetatifactor sp.]